MTPRSQSVASLAHGDDARPARLPVGPWRALVRGLGAVGGAMARFGWHFERACAAHAVYETLDMLDDATLARHGLARTDLARHAAVAAGLLPAAPGPERPAAPDSPAVVEDERRVA